MPVATLEKSHIRLRFGKVNRWAELLSYIALILGVPFGLIDLHNHGVEANNNAKVEQENERKEQAAEAHRIYLTVDEHFAEFAKLCIAYPRLDCYSVQRTGKLNPPLSEDEKIQQKMIYTTLTDVFEVAYTEYHQGAESNDEVKRIVKDEWEGWDTYIRKFLKRPSYLQTWNEIKDEYGDEFVKHVDSLISSPQTVETSQVIVTKQR